jgi:hypothetical protein
MKGFRAHYTFLGRDAIKALKEWLKVRERYVTEDSSGYILLIKHKKPLTYPSLYQSWMRVLRCLKMIPHSRKEPIRDTGKKYVNSETFTAQGSRKAPLCIMLENSSLVTL